MSNITTIENAKMAIQRKNALKARHASKRISLELQRKEMAKSFSKLPATSSELPAFLMDQAI